VSPPPDDENTCDVKSKSWLGGIKKSIYNTVSNYNTTSFTNTMRSGTSKGKIKRGSWSPEIRKEEIAEEDKE